MLATKQSLNLPQSEKLSGSVRRLSASTEGSSSSSSTPASSTSTSSLSIVFKSPPIKEIPSFSKQAEVKPRKSMRISSASKPSSRTSSNTRLFGARKYRSKQPAKRASSTYDPLPALPNEAQFDRSNTLRSSMRSVSSDYDKTRSSSVYNSVPTKAFAKRSVSTIDHYNPYVGAPATHELNSMHELKSTHKLQSIRKLKSAHKLRSTHKLKSTHNLKTPIAELFNKRTHQRKHNAAPQLHRRNAIRRKIGWLSTHMTQFLRNLRARLRKSWRSISRRGRVVFRHKNKVPKHQHRLLQKKQTTNLARSFSTLPSNEHFVPIGAQPDLLSPCQMSDNSPVARPPDETVELSRDQTIVFKSPRDDHSDNLSTILSKGSEENEVRSKVPVNPEMEKVLPIWEHTLRMAVSRRIQMYLDMQDAELHREKSSSTLAKNEFLDKYISSGDESSIGSKTLASGGYNSSHSQSSESFSSYSSSSTSSSSGDDDSLFGETRNAAVSTDDLSESDCPSETSSLQGAKKSKMFNSLPPTRTATILEPISGLIRANTMACFTTFKKIPVPSMVSLSPAESSSSTFTFESMEKAPDPRYKKLPLLPEV